MNTVSGPTRSVTCALTLIFAPVGVLTQTYSLLRMPRSAACLGLFSQEFALRQLGEPRVGARLVAAAFVLDQAPARQDQRELLAGVLVLLLHALEQRRQPPPYFDVGAP